MKTSTKAMWLLLPISLLLAALVTPAAIFVALIAAMTLFVKGIIKLMDNIDADNHKRDTETMRAAGGTEAEALLYATLNKRNRDAWIQSAGNI